VGLLDTATGTPDLSGSRSGDPLPYRMNPAFRLVKGPASVAVSRYTPSSGLRRIALVTGTLLAHNPA